MPLQGDVAIVSQLTRSVELPSTDLSEVSHISPETIDDRLVPCASVWLLDYWSQLWTRADSDGTD